MAVASGSGDAVDFSVGFEMLARVGDRVEAGQPLLRVHGDRGRLGGDLDPESVVHLGSEPVEPPPLILDSARAVSARSSRIAS